MTTHQLNIAHQTLVMLRNMKPYLCGEELGFTQVKTVLRRLSLTEFNEVCAELERRAWIKRVHTDDGYKLKITDEGEAEMS